MWDEIQDMAGEIFDMTRLDVICPSCPWEGSTVDASEAPYLAICLSEDHGYAQIRQDGRIIAEYTDGYAS